MIKRCKEDILWLKAAYETLIVLNSICLGMLIFCFVMFCFFFFVFFFVFFFCFFLFFFVFFFFFFFLFFFFFCFFFLVGVGLGGFLGEIEGIKGRKKEKEVTFHQKRNETYNQIATILNNQVSVLPWVCHNFFSQFQGAKTNNKRK